MIHITDDESNVTTESRQIFGIFYKFYLRMLFMPGSWEF